MEHNLAGANIDKKSVYTQAKIWIAADPLLHLPIAIGITSFFNILFTIMLIHAFGWLKEYKVFQYSIICFLVIMALLTSYILIELFKDLQHYFRVKALKRKTEIDNVIHYMNHRPDDHKNSEARHLFDAKHRIIDILSGRGGASPTEIITPDAPIVESVEEPPLTERKIELFKGGESEGNFYFTIVGVAGKVSFKQVADWKSAAYVKFQKDPKQQENYRLRKAEFDKCLELRNKEFIRRVVDLHKVDTNNTDLAVFFREQRTEQGSTPWRVVGKMDSCIKYINNHQQLRELNQLPDPKLFHVKIEEYKWRDNLQMNSTGYGCVFEVRTVAYEK